MNIKCLIVDDKPLAIDILADYIKKIPFLELAATTTNPIEGLNILRTQSIHLVFLDIQMSELNGLQFIKIAGKETKIILTTAYSKYALDGYEHDVIDYLLKPIAFDRFYRAAEKAMHILQPKNTAALFSPTGIETPERQNAAAYLFVKTEHRIQKVNLNDVLYIEGLQNYISIHTGTDKVLSLQTLKKVEEQLPPAGFIRVHKSFIIAFKHITYIERSRIFIGEAIVPIGDSYRDEFYKRIGSQ